MPSVRHFVAGLAALALAASAAVLLGMPASWPAEDAVLAGGAFAAAFFVAQRLGFLLHWRGQAARISLEEFAVVVGLLVVPGPVLVAAVAASALVSQLLTRRPALKATFNVAQYVLGASLAVGAFAGLRALGVAPLWAAVPAPFVFALTSQASTATLFALLEKASPLRTFRARFLHWTVITSVVGLSLGLGSYALWRLHPVLIVAILPVFLLLTRFGRLTEWAEEEVRVHSALAEATTRVAATGDFDAITQAILERSGVIFGAGEVRLTLAVRPGPPQTWAWKHEQGASAHGIRVVVPMPAGEPGEMVIFPRPGQRAYGERDRHLLAIVAAAVASSAANRRALDELQEANLRLSNANRELEEFTLWTTHDMREPLRSVGQLARILHEDLDDLSPGEVRDLTGRIHKGAEGLKDRIKALHEFSRVVQEDVAFTMVDLNDVLDEAREGLTARIAERGARISCPEPLPAVRAQHARILNVVCNLLENALKYNDKTDPLVQVSCRDAGDEWELSVRDNGPGIDPAFRERVFKLFQRGPGAKESGSGAGLAIVKRIVEQHGGRVW
ncbi:MAG TPA: ATP-binding protein, partial [Candidatus Thermoplasmatota archaeon]|nr:ATP-binding protein [Candidatus Thermoplasmatota archaeon]